MTRGKEPGSSVIDNQCFPFHDTSWTGKLTHVTIKLYVAAIYSCHKVTDPSEMLHKYVKRHHSVVLETLMFKLLLLLLID